MASQRHPHRTRQRGAALVEAGIVAPMFAMMFILHVFIAGTYEAKIESAQTARADAFFYAGNNCSKGNGDSAGESGQGTDPNANNQGQGGVPSQPPQMDNSIFIGHAKASKSFHNPIGGSSQPAWQDKTVTSESWVMCNEGPYGMNVIKYIGGMIQQAGF